MKDVVRLYEQGLSTYKIAKIYDVDRSTISNWLKKLGVVTRPVKRVNDVDKIKLSDIQKQFLIGSLLGDGYISKARRNARYQTSHSVKQKDYIFWIKDVFGSLGKEPKLYDVYNKQVDKTYQMYNFRTSAAGELNDFKDLFYDGRKKVVREELISLLISPLSLAVWIMEDGSKETGKRGFVICTDSFGYNENKLLVSALRNNFSLSPKIIKYKNNFRMRFGAKEYKKLEHIVGDYIIDSMKYKLRFIP